MKTNDDILDRNILVPFEKTFRAMGIGDYQIATAIQDFSLPPLDFDTREKLLTGRLIATLPLLFLLIIKFLPESVCY